MIFVDFSRALLIAYSVENKWVAYSLLWFYFSELISVSFCIVKMSGFLSTLYGMISYRVTTSLQGAYSFRFMRVRGYRRRLSLDSDAYQRSDFVVRAVLLSGRMALTFCWGNEEAL